jgi:hypothetical protein
MFLGGKPRENRIPYGIRKEREGVPRGDTIYRISWR